MNLTNVGMNELFDATVRKEFSTNSKDGSHCQAPMPKATRTIIRYVPQMRNFGREYPPSNSVTDNQKQNTPIVVKQNA
jgi:hypothetical protein